MNYRLSYPKIKLKNLKNRKAESLIRNRVTARLWNKICYYKGSQII
jgi:hypothetical protein